MGFDTVGMIAKLFNFALLAGTLVYFLRTPFATHLSGRSLQIQSDLVKAAAAKASAAEQSAEIDKKMSALPAELDALRVAGAAEVVAEETRIRQAADAERARLLEQTRREIDVQLKIAERGLVQLTADLAVAVATERLRTTITDADQVRLVDRDLAQVGTTRASR